MPDSGHVMLTVLLHHDQSKTLDEIMAHLKKTGFYRDFPPEGSELVSWGAFRYQVFPSYDFAPIAADLKKQHS